MALGIVLGSLGVGAGGFGGAVLGAVGGIVGSQLDQIVLQGIFRAPGARSNVGDIDVTLATEGTSGTLAHECLHLLAFQRHPLPAATDEVMRDYSHTGRHFLEVARELAAKLGVACPEDEAGLSIFPVTRADIEALGEPKVRALREVGR